MMVPLMHGLSVKLGVDRNARNTGALFFVGRIKEGFHDVDNMNRAQQSRDRGRMNSRGFQQTNRGVGMGGGMRGGGGRRR